MKNLFYTAYDDLLVDMHDISLHNTTIHDFEIMEKVMYNVINILPQNYPNDIKFISFIDAVNEYIKNKSLNNTKTVIKYFIKASRDNNHHKSIDQYFPQEALKNIDIILLLLLISPEHFMVLPNKYKQQQFYDHYFEYINDNIFSQQYYSKLLNYIPTQFQTREMCLICIKRCPSTTLTIPDLLKETDINELLFNYHNIFTYEQISYLNDKYLFTKQVFELIITNSNEYNPIWLDDELLDNHFESALQLMNKDRYMANIVLGYFVSSRKKIIILNEDTLIELLNYIDITILKYYYGNISNKLTPVIRNEFKKIAEKNYIDSLLERIENEEMFDFLMYIRDDVLDNTIYSDKVVMNILNTTPSNKMINTVKTLLKLDLVITEPKNIINLMYMDINFIKAYHGQMTNEILKTYNEILKFKSEQDVQIITDDIKVNHKSLALKLNLI